MPDYIGITIGPIVKTLSFAETPIQLWYASYLFSSLTEKICEELKSKDFEILCPHYIKNKPNDGIGRYHDRIIINVGEKESELVDDCIKTAKDYIITKVFQDYDKVKTKYGSDEKIPKAERMSKEDIESFLENYISIHWAKFSIDEMLNENPILKSGYILDMLEQMPSIEPTDDHNIFKVLFGSKTGKRKDGKEISLSNKYMTECMFLTDPPINDNGNFFADKGKKFRSIPDISGSDENKKAFKKYSYFAVVQADVDSMGNYISKLSSSDGKSIDKKIKEFSEKCFEYVKKAADIITAYGGMVIYAGGDDLLFLAPVEKNEKNVFDVIEDIRKKFGEVFTDDKSVTVSFGVSIRYEKYPLYEALESARNALFGTAKNYSGKNAVVVDFSKHSGQAIKLCVPFERFTSFREIIKICRKPTSESEKKEQTEKSEEVVNSAIYNMDILKELFVNAESEDVIKNILNNQYDNKTQETYTNYILKVSEKLYEHLCLNDDRKTEMYCNEGSVEKQYKDIKAFELSMRLGKFLSERGAENGKISDKA